MGKGKISDKQTEILEYIKEEQLKKGYPPSVREICKAVGLKSTSSVHAHLASLEENGYIRRDPTKPRAIEIIDDDLHCQGVRLLIYLLLDRLQRDFLSLPHRILWIIFLFHRNIYITPIIRHSCFALRAKV